MIRSRRLGKFRVHANLINSCPELVLELMKDMIVLKVEDYDYWHILVYTVVYFRFREIDEGEKIPEYDIALRHKEYPDGTRIGKLEIRELTSECEN